MIPNGFTSVSWRSLLNPGDRIKFDHMGKEHQGVILEVTASNGKSLSHDVICVKADDHASCVVINITLFPGRVRKDESR